MTKRDALDVAKRQATSLELPFDLQQDVCDEVDLTAGPLAECLLCGSFEHSFEPFVCSECICMHEAGKQVRAEKITVQIGQYNFFRARGTDSRFERAVIETLLEVFEGAVEPGGVCLKQGVPTLGEGGINRVVMSQAQWDALENLAELLAQGFATAYSAGKKDGAFVLRRIAAGELSQSDLDKALSMQKAEFEE